jgi:AcrR family transcriptional regulator
MKSRKEHILDEAARLFRQKGYAATSVQDVAEAVGIKAASLYNHISSKQEILKDICLPISEVFNTGMEGIQNSSLSSIEKLEALVNLHVNTTQQYKDKMALITGDWIHLDGQALQTYKRSRKKYEKDFISILDDCKKDGFLDAKLNTEISLFSILSSLHWLYSWRERHQEISVIELEKQLRQILLNGIKK